LIFSLLFFASASSAADKPGKVLILFDQSGSMHQNDPKLISKVWLTAFIKAFKEPYDVTLAGFDDGVYEQIRITTEKKKDVEAIAEKVEKIETRGLTTDQEAPLRYLLESDEIDPVSFAVIVSDGEPEIWDEKRFYLSRKIRSDSRYEDLNKQYRLLKSRGLSKRELFDKLYSQYHARNLELIRERLAMIRERFGSRLVFLDISGEFEYFKNWADAAGAEYIPVPARGDISSVDRLRMTITALLKKASEVAQEPLPADSDMLVEPMLEAEPVSPAKEPATPETPEKTETAETAEPVEAEPLQEKQKQATPPEKAEVTKKEKIQGPGGSWVVFLFIFILAAVLIFISFRSRRISKPEAAEPVEPPTTMPAEEKGPDMDGIRKMLTRLMKASLKEADSYIDTEIDKAVEAADKARLEKLKFEFNLQGSERRFALRIPVPPGAMQVYWTDENGEKREGEAVNISMHGVLFKAPGINAEGIDCMKCPGLNVDFHITSSRVEKKEGDLAVATLDEFEDNVNARMKWVEILTRIEEGRLT
jgi:Na+-transporting methylmalonyl-CoA/oxaloacetate decarboxylase gamma subunit